MSFTLIGTIAFNFLCVLRFATLAHYSYFIGNYIYPERCYKAGFVVFCVIVASALIPGFLFPRLKLLTTALSLPPQLHLLVILNQTIATNISNESVVKSVRIYTISTLLTMAWTIGHLVRRSFFEE